MKSSTAGEVPQRNSPNYLLTRRPWVEFIRVEFSSLRWLRVRGWTSSIPTARDYRYLLTHSSFRSELHRIRLAESSRTNRAASRRHSKASWFCFGLRLMKCRPLISFFSDSAHSLCSFCNAIPSSCNRAADASRWKVMLQSLAKARREPIATHAKGVITYELHDR